MGPSSEWFVIAETRNTVIVGVPEGKLGELGASVSCTHYQVPHIIASINSYFLAWFLCSCHQSCSKLTIFIKIFAPSAARTSVSFHVNPDRSVMIIASEVANHLGCLTLRCFSITVAWEHVDSNLSLSETCSLSIHQNLMDVRIECSIWSPGSCYHEGMICLLQTFQWVDWWDCAQVKT